MSRASLPYQPSFEDLGTPLYAVTFVVVDLETTGGSPAHDRITEFGAVKTRGGEIVGEFASLVDPGQAIPASISALTGITDAMVAERPPVEAVLPSFLEFCRGAALVAHNARFDIGFLNAGLVRLGYPRLGNCVVCTASLARRVVRDEVRDCKLATLARFFRCRTVPVHRALADARATVEVFHGLLERAGTFGVLTLEDLADFARVRNAPLFSSRRHLADGLPSEPGVYAFRSASGEVLYVGKAGDLRARVRSYFGNDDRRKVVDLLKETATVLTWVTPTALEAAVREVRLIAAHRPRFNRRSKHPERRVYVKLTAERFPRLSTVRRLRPGDTVYLGPLSPRTAAAVSDAVTQVVPLRRCTPRIGASTRFAACALAEMGRCLSPCDGSVSVERYAATVAVVREAVTGDPLPLLGPLEERMRALARAGRFEEAAAVRERLRAVAVAVERTRRLTRTAAAGTVTAWRPARDGRADVVVVSAGRLVASRTCATSDVAATATALRATISSGIGAPAGTAPAGAAATTGQAPPAGAAAPTPQRPAVVAADDAEEAELVSRWLAGRGVVVLHCDGELSSGVAGGRQLAALTARLGRVHRSTGRPAAELAAKRTRREARAPVP